MTTSQTPVHIGNVIRNALIFDFKNWPAGPMNADSLSLTVSQLFALLQKRRINYVLVGGVALLTYIEGRNTEDIDLIVAVSSLEKLPEIQIDRKDLYFARGRFGDLQIDFLLTENPLFKKVRRKFTTIQHFQEQDIPTASVVGLLLLKLYALPSLYRQGSFAQVGIYENDIATLIHDYSVDMKAILKELSHHLSESDMEEVRWIVGEIQQRIERFRKGSDQSSA